MSKKTLSFSLINLVRVDVTCKNNQSFKENYKVISGLIDFMKSNSIIPVARGGVMGPDTYIAYHSRKDALKIKKWLLEQNVEETEYEI